MKIIDLYQTGALPHTSHIPVINAGISHFSYTAMSIFPYDRQDEKLIIDTKNIVDQRKRYEQYRRQNYIPLINTTDIRAQKNPESYIYHMTGMDLITSMKNLKKIYKGGIRIFQPRREENNARGESYHSHT